MKWNSFRIRMLVRSKFSMIWESRVWTSEPQIRPDDFEDSIGNFIVYICSRSRASSTFSRMQKTPNFLASLFKLQTDREIKRGALYCICQWQVRLTWFCSPWEVAIRGFIKSAKGNIGFGESTLHLRSKDQGLIASSFLHHFGCHVAYFGNVTLPSLALVFFYLENGNIVNPAWGQCEDVL